MAPPERQSAIALATERVLGDPSVSRRSACGDAPAAGDISGSEIL